MIDYAKFSRELPLYANVGDDLIINGIRYHIYGKEMHAAAHEGDGDLTAFDLGNEYCLEVQWEQVRFFQCVTRTRWLLEVTDAKYFDIQSLEIIHQQDI